MISGVTSEFHNVGQVSGLGFFEGAVFASRLKKGACISFPGQNKTKKKPARCVREARER